MEENARKFIDYIAGSFMDMLVQMAGIKFAPKKEPQNSGDQYLDVIIAFKGKQRGLIVLEIGCNAAGKIAEGINGGLLDDPSEIDICMGEFTNIFAGDAITKINDSYHKSHLRLSPPAVRIALASLPVPDASETTLLTSEYGDARIEIWFYKQDAAMKIVKKQIADIIDGTNMAETAEKKKIHDEPGHAKADGGRADRLDERNFISIHELLSDIDESGVYEIRLDYQLPNADSEFLDDFYAETKEHIENIELNVLELDTNPDNMEIINSIFRSFHTIKGLAGFVNYEMVQDLAHQTETLLNNCRKGLLKATRRIVDILLISADLVKKACADLTLSRNEEFLKSVAAYIYLAVNYSQYDMENNGNGRGSGAPQENQTRKIGEILVDQGAITQEELHELLDKQTESADHIKLGQLILKENKLEAKEIVQSLRMQEGKKINYESGFLRLPISKVDNLVDIMGELLILQSQIEQEAYKRFGGDDTFVSNMLRMERITKELQGLAMSLRMISLRSTFQKINRIAHDCISRLNKNIQFQYQGEGTEIDRGVAEKILDPLIHLVKNAISHGIENERERIAAGKPACGNISVHAYSKRGSVYIEVIDDGHGLDVEKIRQKAVEKKLITPEADITVEDLLNFIFLPGFSTATMVDNVAGRGVGLDVVKTEISKIGGRVDCLSEAGKGCAFILKIPINLAVMNGTIVDILGHRFIIPTVYVKQIVQPQKENWVHIKNRISMFRLRDNIISIIPVAKVLGMDDEAPGSVDKAGLVIVLELEQQLKALPVQSVLGRQEIVVKSLGVDFNHIDFLSGASILGDGRVSLIFDIENLFKLEFNNAQGHDSIH